MARIWITPGPVGHILTDMTEELIGISGVEFFSFGKFLSVRLGHGTQITNLANIALHS